LNRFDHKLVEARDLLFGYVAQGFGRLLCCGRRSWSGPAAGFLKSLLEPLDLTLRINQLLRASKERVAI
jgi:hypothetical protein